MRLGAGSLLDSVFRSLHVLYGGLSKRAHAVWQTLALRFLSQRNPQPEKRAPKRLRQEQMGNPRTARLARWQGWNDP